MLQTRPHSPARMLARRIAAPIRAPARRARTPSICFCWLALLLVDVSPARAEDTVLMPGNIIFVTSTGYWEESGDALSVPDPNTGTTENAPAATAPETGRRGYYKLIAVRQPEGNAHVFLQQIALDAAGPKVVSSAELEEFSAMKAYVTDIRPESSDGVARQPGLFATVYLKSDPAAAEPETWTVLIDDIGDITVERATN